MDSKYKNSSQVLKQANENKDQFMLDVLGGGTAVMEEVKRFGIPEARNDTKTLGKATTTALYKTVDGYGLRSFPHAIGPSEWLTDGIDRMASDQWLKCVKVRAAVLQNRLRESRYKPFTNTICAAAYLVNESLGHITDVPRHTRHNSLVKMLARKLSAIGFIARIEPRIPTVEGTKFQICVHGKIQHMSCTIWQWDQTLPTWIKFISSRFQNMTCRESING